LSLLLNHSEKWAFIHVPKTGGTSINKVLLTKDSVKIYTSHDSIRAVPDDEYFIFTIVRNPFTRLMSAWQHGVRKNIYSSNFREFTETINQNDTWIIPQSYYINEGKTNTKEVSFIGRYENLLEDTAVLFKKLNYKEKLPHLNNNPIHDNHPNLNQEKYYKYYYSEEWMKEWVRERYENDFKIFNYGMDL